MIEAWLAAKLGGFGGKLVEYGIVFAVLAGAMWFAYSWAYDRGVASQQPIVALAQEREHAATTANAQNNEQIVSLTNRLNACTATVAANVQQAQASARQLTQQTQQAAQDAAKAKHERDALIEEWDPIREWAKGHVPDALVREIN